MAKGAKASTGYVYSVMQELQQLRDKAAALSDANRELAKALVRASIALCLASARRLTYHVDREQNDTKAELARGALAVLCCVLRSAFADRANDARLLQSSMCRATSL